MNSAFALKYLRRQAPWLLAASLTTALFSGSVWAGGSAGTASFAPDYGMTAVPPSPVAGTQFFYPGGEYSAGAGQKDANQEIANQIMLSGGGMPVFLASDSGSNSQPSGFLAFEISQQNREHERDDDHGHSGVPEPSSFLLMGGALAALALFRGRKVFR